MRNLFFLLAVILFASCERGVTIHSQFTKAEYEKMGNAVMGTYHGKYMVFSWTHDGDVTVKEIPDATISVSAWDKQQVIFRDFPISMLSKTLAEDSFVSQYLGSRPDQDLVSSYTFDGRERESSGKIYFYHQFLTPISFTTEPDASGVKHYIELSPTNGSIYESFTMDECNQPMILRHDKYIAVDIADMTDNGKSLAGEWPSFTRMQVHFLYDE